MRTKQITLVACGLLAMTVLVCARATSRPHAEDQINLSIECIVPNLRALQIDGYPLAVSRAEHSVVSAIEGFQDTWGDQCNALVTLSNPTNQSYCLCSWDVQALLVHRVTFRDEHGNRWKLQDTFSHAHPDSLVYNVPSIAGVKRSMILRVGLCRFVPANATPGAAVAGLPKWLDYEVEPDAFVRCRQVEGKTLAPSGQVRLTGKGRCTVDAEGWR